MKLKSTILTLLIAVLAIALTGTACKKSTTNTIDPIVCDSVDPGYLTALLQFKNSQGQNLLDPATPGHYDTAYVKKQNSWASIVNNGAMLRINLDYWNNNQNVLVLAPAKWDTLHVVTQAKLTGCFVLVSISEFKYNGVVLPPDSAVHNLYTVRK